jgi:hypothetical protein
MRQTMTDEVRQMIIDKEHECPVSNKPIDDKKVLRIDRNNRYGKQPQ